MSAELSPQQELGINYDSPESIPVKYSLPFSWGSVNVSEAANLAYNLQPVNGLALENYSPEPFDLKRSPKVALWLLASGEVVDPGELPQFTAREVPEGITIDTKLNASFVVFHDSKKINVFAAFPNSALVRETLISQLREETGADLEDEMKAEVDESLSQNFIHVACGFIEQCLPGEIQKIYEEKDIKRQIRMVTALGAVGAAGAGYFAAAGGPSDIVTGVTAASFGLAMTYLQRDGLRGHFLKNAAARSSARSAIAAVYASRISQEVHNVYCRHE